MEEKLTGLVWAIVWAILLILAIVAIFWNPAHWVMAFIAVCMTVLFIHDYRTTRNL